MGKRIFFMLWWVVRSIVLGICVGCAMWALNTGVGLVSTFRESHPLLLLLIPMAALSVSWLYQWLGPYLRSGTATVIQMINNGISGDAYKHDEQMISVKMAPLLFVSTLLSHLFGASTGKEGAGVQIGASIGNYLSHVEDMLLPKRWEQHDATTQGIWLIMGAGAAFGALFNAPVAGMLFGLQFSAPGVNRTDAYIPCVVASFSAVLFSQNVLHTVTLSPALAESVVATPLLLAQLAVIAVAMGLFCMLFLGLASWWKNWLASHVPGVYRPVLVSSALVLAVSLALYPLFGGFPLNGLSADLIGKQVAWYIPFLKLLLTVLSMGASFVGGEVVPVLVLGSTFGSLFQPLLGIPINALVSFASMGMLSAATKLPFVCAMLGLELFGFSNPALLFFVCLISYAASGSMGIYAKQQPTIALGGR
ncbi:MAG: chloride channel protein [Sphaerochaetaceae bacterium]|nr:chloride channel protein [Spirochaetales bacterium]MDY5499259.1 chloride channel protein [Sphaerochaetaceae bacterium]